MERLNQVTGLDAFEVSEVFITQSFRMACDGGINK